MTSVTVSRASVDTRPAVEVTIQVCALSLVLGGALALVGRPDLALVVFGGVLFWGLQQAAAPDEEHRVGGQAVTLCAVLGALTLSLPRFLAGSADTLLVLSLAASPLLWLCITAPTARRTLALRLPTPLDAACLYAGALLSLGVVAVLSGLSGRAALPAAPPNLMVVSAIAILLPVYAEAVFRGLLMRALGTSSFAILLTALVAGTIVGSGFGVTAMNLTTVSGVVMGIVRRMTGHWQPSLMINLGASLGLLVAYTSGSGVMG